MRSWWRTRSTLWHGLPLALAFSAAGCSDAPAPPPVAVLQRSDAPPVVIEPLFADKPLQLAAPLSASETLVTANQTPATNSIAPTHEPASESRELSSNVKRVDAIEPLPSVNAAQLATAFEYPSTDAPLEPNGELLPASRAVEAMAPVLSSEPLTSTEPFEPQVPAAVAPRTHDAPLSTATTPPLPSAPRIQEAMMLTNQASVDFQKGVALATRGSMYAARSKFLRTLDQLSQAADAQTGSRTREPALQAALRALEEMEDFVSRRGGAVTASDLTLIVRSHQTKVIALDEAKQLTTTEALMCYLQFAKHQLAEAFQGMAHAAGPMHALGRVYDSLADHSSLVAAQDKARVFYESALAVDPTHSATANDLAVLLARHGRWNEAQGLLTRSVSLRPTAAGYQNLAVVQERLGQPQLAAQSRQLAATGGTSATALADPALMPWQNVRWLEAKSFAQTSELASDPRAVANKEPGKPQPAPVARTAANPDLRAAGRWQQ